MSNDKTIPTALPLNVATLKGRIDNIRTYNGKHYTQITTPAPDAYSSPSRFELRSNQALGQPGIEIEARVFISGFIRHFNFKDKNTGMSRDGSECSVYLDVIP